MPVCFSLTRNGEDKPTNLLDVDEDICKALGVTPDPVRFYANWYDTIGLMLAVGKSFGDIEGYYVKCLDDPNPKIVKQCQTKLDVIRHLAKNYISDAWREFR